MCIEPSALNNENEAALSEIGFGAKADDRNRPTVAVIGGIDHELIIDRGLPVVHRKQIIGLDDLLRAGMRQLSVADQDAQPAIVEKLLVDLGNAVDDGGERKGVVRAAPLGALQRQAGGGSAVDIGIGVRLYIAAGKANSREQSEIGRDLLFEIGA